MGKKQSIKKATKIGDSLMRQEDLWHSSRASHSTQYKLLSWRVGTDSPISGRLPEHLSVFQGCPNIPILDIHYDFHRNFTPSSLLVLLAFDTKINKVLTIPNKFLNN